MRLEIPLTEVQDFLSDCYKINVGLKNIEENKIEVNYFASLVLTIKEVKENKIIFQYEVNGFVDFLSKGAHFFLGRNLDDASINWNSATNEVTIDLNKIHVLSVFLKFFHISELRFVNENILLVLKTKSN